MTNKIYNLILLMIGHIVCVYSKMIAVINFCFHLREMKIAYEISYMKYYPLRYSNLWKYTVLL